MAQKHTWLLEDQRVSDYVSGERPKAKAGRPPVGILQSGTAMFAGEGIEIIAGIPGGAILLLQDALTTSTIQHVLARHEQGATFVVQGMACSTGKVAVCLARAAPGATNLVIALANARSDFILKLVITA